MNEVRRIRPLIRSSVTRSAMMSALAGGKAPLEAALGAK